MNIYFDGTIFSSPSKDRGLGIHAYNLLENLIKLMKDSNIYLVNYNGMEIEERFYPDNVKRKSINLGPIKNTGINRDWLFTIKPLDIIGALIIEKELIVDEIDIFFIFNHDENPFNFIKIIKDRGRCKTKFVLGIQDLIPLVFSSHYLPTKELYERYYRKASIVKDVDAICANSKSACEDIVKFYNIEYDKIFITYLGCKLKNTKVNKKFNDIANKYGIEKPYMIYVGGDEWRKNIDGLIMAFAQTTSNVINNYQLVIVCKIGNKEYYDKIINTNNLKNKVVFTDYIEDEELFLLYQNAYASIFPSKYEGFGLPILEAMYFDLPVIASSTSSMPEIVGEQGITFNPNDIKDIANKITLIMSDKKVREEQIAVSKERRNLFSFEDCAIKTIEVFNNVIQEKRSRIEGSVNKYEISHIISDFLYDIIKIKYKDLFDTDLINQSDINLISKLIFSCNNYINKKIRLIYDGTVLQEGYQKQAHRSGIFFVAYNILEQMLFRDDIDVVIYCEKESEYKVRSVLQNISINVWSKVSFYSDLSINDNEIEELFDIYFSPCYHVPKFFRKFNKLKRIVYLYDAIPIIHPEYFNNVKKEDTWNYKIIESASKDDFYIACSTSTKNDYLKISEDMNRDNIRVIFPSANSDIFYNEKSIDNVNYIKRKYGITKKYVLSLCTIEPRKNLIFAVKSFMEFIKKYNIDDLQLILGGGQWTFFYDQYGHIFEDYGDTIKHIGYVDDDDMAALYTGAECFIYPSLYEGFGLPPLEAMMCGTAVITSNNSSLPEVVGDAALCIDANNKEDFINALAEIYFNEECKKYYIKKGCERSKLFSWKKTGENIVNFIYEIVNGKTH